LKKVSALPSVGVIVVTAATGMITIVIKKLMLLFLSDHNGSSTTYYNRRFVCRKSENFSLFGCDFKVIYLLLTLIFACCCNRMTMINYDDVEYGILALLL
jgi:hypothetical protein